MKQETASERIVAEVTRWLGVEAAPGERGELSLRVNGREIGHLHGDRVAHFSFPREVGSELRASGRVGPHPVAPTSVKLAARRIDDQGDEQDVIAMLRLNYDRLVTRPGVAKGSRVGG